MDLDKEVLVGGDPGKGRGLGRKVLAGEVRETGDPGVLTPDMPKIQDLPIHRKPEREDIKE